LPRRLRPIAKAPLFGYPIIGQFARLSGAIAVHRRQDEGGAVDNRAMFSAARRALEQGEALLIFPEGKSQSVPALMPLRTGTARPGDALGRLIVEAKDRHTLDLVEAAESIWREEMPSAALEAKDRAAWRRRAARAHAHLALTEPARTAALRSRLERYVKDLELAGLTNRDLTQGFGASTVLRYGLREGLALLFGLPLALWGLVNHVVPYEATALVVRLLKP